MVSVGNLFVGVDGVAVAGQRRDVQAVFIDGFHELVDQLGMLHKLHGVRVRGARGTAAADFNLLNAQAFEVAQGFIEGQVAQKNG